VVVWLAYILSEGDHRLNSVQGWAAGILMTQGICLKAVGAGSVGDSNLMPYSCVF